MTVIYMPILMTCCVLAFAVIVFLNNPYRVYFAKKDIDKAIKEQRKRERAQKKLRKMKKIKKVNKVLPVGFLIMIQCKNPNL
ncbi:MAG: hypothetical protein ABF756_02925 [Liquorilactobacillus ghanensis]|uniref:hypothetical protein n=1 Tax=Liquorilactobacillus ghanensis TaxID=399370 RepID=UPI0039E8565F